MKKIKELLKSNIKFILGFILGLSFTIGSVYAAEILFASENVGYDNTTSGLSSTDVQGALDELYSLAQTCGTPSANSIYRWSISSLYIGDSISSLTPGTDYVTDKSQVTNMNAKASKYFLQHDISNNEVTNSYVCFVVTSAMATANPGMVAGEYCLEGGDSGAAFTDNMNKIKTAFDYAGHSSRCGGNQTSYFSCGVSGLNAYARSYGSVFASGDDGTCYVYNDGDSNCYE